MPSVPATKAGDKQQACKKVIALLQKDYGKSIPKLDLPVLETTLFAVCLEDNRWEAALEGYQRLHSAYFDLNELRVSSVSEIESTLSDLKEAAWKGLRIRAVLRYVFEKYYAFDFEKLRRLTLDSAQKRLKKIDGMSPFVVSFVMQQSLGMHVVCLDDSSHRAAQHLGLVPPDVKLEAAAEFLKAGVKKSEAFTLAHYLRLLGTEEKLQNALLEPPEADTEFDILNVEARLQELKSPKRKKRAKTVEPAAPARKASKANKTSAKSGKPASTGKAAASKKKTSASSKATRTSDKKVVTKKVSTKKAEAKKGPAPAKAGSRQKAATRKVTTKKKPASKKADTTTSTKKSASRKSTSTKKNK